MGNGRNSTLRGCYSGDSTCCQLFCQVSPCKLSLMAHTVISVNSTSCIGNSIEGGFFLSYTNWGLPVLIFRSWMIQSPISIVDFDRSTILLHFLYSERALVLTPECVRKDWMACWLVLLFWGYKLQFRSDEDREKMKRSMQC